MNYKVLPVTIWLLMCVSAASIKAKIDPKTAVGIWLFDEGEGRVAHDLSDRGPKGNGKLEKGAKWAKGKFGHGIEFDGKDDYVQIAPSDRYNPKNAKGIHNFTVTFWMYPRSIGGNNPAGKGSATLVIANGDPGDGGGANWWFEFWKGGNFEFKSCQAGCAAATTAVNAPDEWYFITGIYNGKEYELYVNGEFKHKGPNVIGNPEKGLLIGSGLCPAGHGCDGGYFKGIIDDVVVFNVILDEAAIGNLMKKGAGQTLGVLAVHPHEKLTTTWSVLKTD